MDINPLLAIDFYKADHRRQYPEGTTLVYSNLTPRANHLSNLKPDAPDKIVFFGLQYFIIDYLMVAFEVGFFEKPKDEVVGEYKRVMDKALGPDSIPVDHIGALHDLGYLPLEIRAVPEGSKVSMRVPCLTIHNTHPDFFWLVNYIESVMSCYLWKSCVSATTAHWYKGLFDKYAEMTSSAAWFTDYQGHDFSFRGMSGPQDAALSGAAHLTSFLGTDTVPAIQLIEENYTPSSEDTLIGTSVPATEHSVMCMGTQDNEIETFRRLITDLYPSGIVSIVSDTWDFWKVITKYLPALKDEVMAREGNPIANKVVIRPDSGDPVKIICGDLDYQDGDHTHMTPQYKGAIECLWDTFGGTVNEKGYKELDSHIGLIYGDSITPERATAIMKGLEDKGFASTNVVLGIGSYTYQYVTRDTYGFAVKATYGVVDGVGREICKDPKTDDGTKKSAKGLLKVINGKLFDQEANLDVICDLKVVFKDGELVQHQSIEEIRARLKEST